jgi:asparagine synthetase B (glutamine-hydrolysing)
MCGIVGLFLKDPSLEPKDGGDADGMLVTMSDRGPDSAGVRSTARERRGGQADGAVGCARRRLRDIGRDAVGAARNARAARRATTPMRSCT